MDSPGVREARRMAAATRIDARETASYRATVARLQHAQKRAKGGPAYTIFVNRWFGGRLAALAYVRGLTPNMVTAISAAFSLAGVVLLVLAPVTAVLAALLLLVGYAFDAADGQLARLRGGGSTAGEWLDHMVDAVKITALHLAVLVHLYRFSDLSNVWLLVPIGFTLSSVMHFFAYVLNDLLRRGAAPTSNAEQLAPSEYEPASPVNAILKLPVDFGILCMSFALLPAETPFILVYTVLCLCTTAYVMLAACKWFRDMNRLGGTRP
jgi:phosphatidylglycerophosphate synthase